ncbi:MAG: hypothetical protein [Wendovervirus sonii]|uniref:Phage protein n=1 Tax=phage Lak_Megaphage_Sonny TaxID=3109229 RepID=A0ABZ0Z3U2_9CAUD|nr:MAG: hypothetical protein [phage Lak_Megaphage_Sonny]
MKNISVEEIQKYIGKLVRMSYAYEWRNFTDYKTVICSVVEVNTKLGYIFLGHPYDIAKQQMVAGQMGIRYEFDDFEFSPANEEDLKLWKEEYNKFHNSVIKEKHYDCCEEEIEKIII